MMDQIELSLPGSNERERRQLLVAMGVAGGVAAIATAVPFVASLEPSEEALAHGAAIEVDISDLAPGASKTVEWRGKPVWIVHRTAAMIAALQQPNPGLVDPESKKSEQPSDAANATRSIHPEMFVAVGICTHLGCSPNPMPVGSSNPALGANWPGGYFCPCHGSTFDGAGRVYKNKPAPTNLEVPPYRYLSATRIRIGADGT